MTDSETFFSEMTLHFCLTHRGDRYCTSVHWEGHIVLADKSVHYRNTLPLSPPLHVQSGGFVMTDLVIKWESCWVSDNASIPPASPSPQTHTHTHQMFCYCPVSSFLRLWGRGYLYQCCLCTRHTELHMIQPVFNIQNSLKRWFFSPFL